MKIAEALFEIGYLLIAFGLGLWLLRRRTYNAKLTGLATLILGFGDAFHLIPRIAQAFDPAPDRTVALGLGKFVTSVTMAIFYLLLELAREDRRGGQDDPKNRRAGNVMFILFLVRAALCFLPQNEWTSANPPLLWGIIRNVPFVAMGVMTVVLWKRSGAGDRCYRFMPPAVSLSFLFYLPVVLLAGTVPAVGMLMLPKTLMYVWIMLMFYNAAHEKA